MLTYSPIYTMDYLSIYIYIYIYIYEVVSEVCMSSLNALILQVKPMNPYIFRISVSRRTFNYLYMDNTICYVCVRPKNAKNSTLATQTLGPIELKLCRHDPWVFTKCFHQKFSESITPGRDKNKSNFPLKKPKIP